ncbi:Alkaline phosphatase [Thermobaculum terrenum ATCC BAA-798]|uniref:Alkaline phosphatase n=1 Tax=Thermobaculum terrenum (strain ATCC BAA-798 / CCMEE 7001 / YNP1) TaxID=525904 RepID=D1CHI4_THET1|nr:Alkaline phosphatase [Thermobaculum terrenum ATCC BAA-798]
MTLKSKVVYLLLAIALVMSVPLAIVRGAGNRSPVRARSVIFLMGDGMGATQRDAIQLVTVGPYGRLTMDQLPYTGMMSTNSVDPKTFVTDSAAGATAWAIGRKTYNGAIAVDAQGKPWPTLLEEAKQAGKSVGLVTTSQVTDASPAAFGAHVEDRDEQSEIARQYLESSKVDVILGGGEDYWYPKGDPGAFPDHPKEDPEEGSKGNRGNLVREAKRLGYTYVTDRQELMAARGPKVLGLFANEEMFQQRPEGEGAVYSPVVSLPEMTQKAIDILSRNPRGFFLFVEQEAIDEMGHNNNSELLMKAGQELDKSVGVALDYAKESGDTLVLVTGDHECCGLTLEGPDDPKYPDEDGREIKGNISGEDGPFKVARSSYRFKTDWTTTGHTPVDVPVSAYGPYADRLVGNYENTHLHEVLQQALGLGPNGMPETGRGWWGHLAAFWRTLTSHLP